MCAEGGACSIVVGRCSADERGDIRQRVVDHASPVPRHPGVPREADEHSRVHQVPLHPEAARQPADRVVPALALFHAGRRHELGQSATRRDATLCHLPTCSLRLSAARLSSCSMSTWRRGVDTGSVVGRINEVKLTLHRAWLVREDGRVYHLGMQPAS